MTNEAMIVSCTMMRIADGMALRMTLTDRFDSAVIAITASDITTAVSILVVTARRGADAEHLQCDRVVLKERIEKSVLRRHTYESSAPAKLVEVRLEAVGAEPEVEHIRDAAAGDGRPGEAVDLVGV